MGITSPIWLDAQRHHKHGALHERVREIAGNGVVTSPEELGRRLEDFAYDTLLRADLGDYEVVYSLDMDWGEFEVELVRYPRGLG